MKRVYVIVLILMAVGVSISGAESLDSALINAIECRKSPINDLVSFSYDANPAAMYFRYDSSLTRLAVAGRYKHSNASEVVQEGSGYALADIGVDTYLRMKTDAVVWGNASFTTGTIRDVKWCSPADYERLFPYVIGDSVGGNRAVRQYTFGGGYSRRAGRWTWGAELDYIAAIYYRNSDPRIKDVVSDLSINLGVTYALNDKYNLGVASGLAIYNQDCDVEFYNPMNDIFEYAMTGLGTTYTRFNGSDNPAYKGIGYNVIMQCISSNGLGLNATIGYDHNQMRQILKDNNHLTLTSLASHTFNGVFGYTSKIGNVLVGAVADASWQRRIGTEHLYGSSESNIYPEIGTRDQYYNDKVNVVFTIPIELRPTSDSRVAILPGLGYLYSHEHYMRPIRDLEMQRYYPGIKIDYSCKTSSKTLIGAVVGGEFGFSEVMNRRLTGLDPRSSIGQMVNYNFDMLTADTAKLHLGLSLDQIIGHNTSLSLDLSYDYLHYSTLGLSHYATASVGLKF